MTKKNRHRQLKDLHEKLLGIEPYPWSAVEALIASATPLVKELFPVHFNEFLKVCETPRWTMLPRFSSGGGMWDDQPRRNNLAEAGAAEETSNRRKASDARSRIAGFVETLLTMVDETSSRASLDADGEICSILDRFPAVARALRARPHGRDPLAVNDEYDVQYLLGALLAVKFQDVRPEEWTPSYAGRASRIDFLLKGERIVVETKFARPGHADREVADELIIDKERYRAHSDCGALICFVYDPAHALRNPVALERDLAQDSPQRVRVVIRPK